MIDAMSTFETRVTAPSPEALTATTRQRGPAKGRRGVGTADRTPR
jgi:hypothetical protein